MQKHERTTEKRNLCSTCDDVIACLEMILEETEMDVKKLHIRLEYLSEEESERLTQNNLKIEMVNRSIFEMMELKRNFSIEGS